MEHLDEDVWVLEREILVGNMDLKSHQHMGGNLKPWKLMEKTNI